MAPKTQFRNITLQAARKYYLQQQQQIAQQQTIPQTVVIPTPVVENPHTPIPVMDSPLTPVPTPLEESSPRSSQLILSEDSFSGTLPGRISSPRKIFVRIAIAVLSILLASTLYLIWHSSTESSPLPGITQQSYSSTGNISSTDGIGTVTPTIRGTIASTTSDGSIEVYVAGAVKHPGVYTLPAGARIYQLLRAAGGALSNANLVALNLAAKLVDGQEVYVLAIGEIPPANVGGSASSSGPTASNGGETPAAGPLVNINTASSEALRQGLHVSSITAQKIIDYRTQHGSFTSINQLLQVVSKSIYDRIKGAVTI